LSRRPAARWWTEPPRGRRPPPPTAGPAPFAQDWVDARVLDAALGEGSGAGVLLLGTTGDLAAHYLSAGAARVAFRARHPALHAHMGLRAAALAALPHQSFWSLLGLDAAGRRVWFYHFLQEALPAEVRSHWDAQESQIRTGLARSGRFEVALQALAAAPLPALWGRLRPLRDPSGDPLPIGALALQARNLAPAPAFAHTHREGYAAAVAQRARLCPWEPSQPPADRVIVLDPDEPCPPELRLAPGGALLAPRRWLPPPGLVEDAQTASLLAAQDPYGAGRLRLWRPAGPRRAG